MNWREVADISIPLVQILNHRFKVNESLGFELVLGSSATSF